MGWPRCRSKTFPSATFPSPFQSEADSGYPEMADDIPSMSQAGFFIRNARRIRLEHVEVTGQRGPAFDIDDCTEVEIIPPL